MSACDFLPEPLRSSALSFVSPKLEKRRRQLGDWGLFAREPIERNELLTVMSGLIVDGERLALLPAHSASRTIQIEENLYQVSIRCDEPADYVNHSCAPNAGIHGQVVLVSMREICPDEEITYDYAMTDGSDFDMFMCDCAAPFCRRQVTGADWRDPELWERYEGYFSLYLTKRIAALQRR